MELAIWTTYWYLAWYIFNLRLKPLGITYTNRPFKVIAYFFGLTIPALVVIWFINNTVLYSFIALIVVLVVNTLAIRIQNSDESTPTIRFVLAKAFEVLFQQSMFYLLLAVMIRLSAASFSQAGLYAAAFFGLTHLPLLFLKQIKLRYVYIAASFIGGLVFSYIQLRLEIGVIFTFIIHLLFNGVARNVHQESTD